MKRGEVYFQDSTKRLIKAIEVEIAVSKEETETGLMHRGNADENHGMLFILEMESEEAVWMKDTKIPLDIVFANREKKIEKIYRNAQPFDMTILPSLKPVKYVIETNAGFIDKHRIDEGFFIDWKLNP
jgi:uncharacterized membrane protein (UPF0127 family)